MAAWTSTPRTWTVGETVTAANMNANIRDFANGFGAWATYTPSLSGFTSVTATTTGYYTQVQKTATVRCSVTINTVTTLGTSAITVGLPANASSTTGTDRFICGIYRTNAGVYVPCGVTLTASGGTFQTYTQTPGAANPNMSNWAGNAPAGQVAGDVWTWHFTYETT